MNLLGMVFSLLLILSYGFYACWDKQLSSSRLRKNYVGHETANRKILNSYQSKVYDQLRGKGSPAQPKDETSKAAEPRPKKLELNRACSKINLWPLVQEGREKHPALYELAAKMVRTFYSPLQEKKKRFEYHFLDALLAAAKASEQGTVFALEKVDLNDPDLQRIYYKMLKGTKQWNLSLNLGYPSLLDYVKVENSKDKICLSHAHPDLMTVLFNDEIAIRLYEEIHQQKPPLLTQELVERICTEMHQIAVDPQLFELLELGYPIHEEQKKVFIAEGDNSDVLLRKNISLKG